MRLTRTQLMTFMIAAALGSAACSSDTGTAAAPTAATPVQSSGKQATALDEVPAAVLEVARKSRPDLSIQEAEHEIRDGREYYDVAGLLPDGSELELDMMLEAGTWKVMEVQRDIGPGDVPAPVGEALASGLGDWQAERIIESDQGDGVVIYEFFAADGDETVKHEVKWTENTAELLTEEWAH